MPIFELSNGEWRDIPENSIKKFLKANPDAAYIDDSQPDRYVRYSSYDKYLSRNAQNANVQPTPQQAQAEQPTDTTPVQQTPVRPQQDVPQPAAPEPSDTTAPAPAAPADTTPARQPAIPQPQVPEQTGEWKANTRPRPVNTVSAQIMDVDRTLSDLKRKYSERLQQIVDEQAGQTGGILNTDVLKGLEETDPELRAYKVAMRQLKETRKDLKMQKKRESGWRNWGKFWGNIGRAVGDGRSWDAGVGNLKDKLTMGGLDYYTNNQDENVRAAGEAMAEAIAGRQDVQQEYADQINGWERAGQQTGEMLPFMADFLISNLLGIGEIEALGKVGSRLATKIVGKEALMEMSKIGFKAFVKKYGIKGFGKEAGNWLIKALGTTGDDLIKGAIMADTIQAAKTGADIIDRKLGDLERDSDGSFKWEKPMSWAQAVWQGEANATIENMSEMFGEHLENVVNLKNLSALAKVFGAGKLSSVLASADAKTLDGILGVVNKGLEKAGISDTLGEISEEYYGQLWKTILNLDDAYQQNQDGSRTNLFLTKQFHGDIWGGMFLSMGLMGFARYGGTGAAYASYRHEVGKTDAAAEAVIGSDVWRQMKATIDATTNEDAGSLIDNTLSDPNMTDEERLAVLDYIAASMRYRGFNMGCSASQRGWNPQPLDYFGKINGRDVWVNDYDEENDTVTFIDRDGNVLQDSEGQPDTLSLEDARRIRAVATEDSQDQAGRQVIQGQQTQSYLDGYNSSSEEMNGIKTQYDLHRQKMTELVGEEALSQFDDDPLGYVLQYMEWMKGLTGAERDAAEENLGDMIDYANAKNAYDGMMQSVRDDIDEQVTASDKLVDSRTSRTTGMVQGGVMRDGKKMYVVSGNVVPDNGGTVNRQYSDDSIVVRYEDGSIEMVSPDAIAAVDPAQDAAELKAAAAEQIRQTYAQQAADSIDGTVTQFKAGETYTLTDDQGNPFQITLTEDKDGNVVNPDGTVNATDQNGKPMRITKDMIQQAADRQHAAEAQQAEDERQKRISGEGTQEQTGTQEQGQEPTGQPALETQQEVPQEGPALSRIPKDENGEPIFEQAESPDVAYDAAVEVAGGDVAIAEGSIADEIEERKERIRDGEKAVKQAQKALEEAEKAKPQKGTTYTEKVAARKARAEVIGQAQKALDDANAGLESARRDLDFWRQMAGVRARREAEAEARRKADEAAAAKKAQEEAEQAAAAAAEQTKKDIEDERQKQREEQQEKSETEQSHGQQTQSGNNMEEITPIGEGENGPIYDWTGKGIREAVEFLVKHRAGDLLNVFHRDDVGDIDLVWGNEEGGLFHIIDKHTGVVDGVKRDFKDVNELIDWLEKVLEHGTKTMDKKDKCEITFNGYRVTIRKSFNGNKKNWVISAIDRNRSPKEKGIDPRKQKANREETKEGTALNHTSSSHEAKGAESDASRDSEDKGTENSETSNRNSAYTVTPYDYTKKNGDVLHMYKVDFGRELTPEERQQLKPILSETRGWYDRNAGAYLMRSEEDAKRLGDALTPKETAETKENTDNKSDQTKENETKTEETKEEPKKENKKDTKESVVETANRIATEERKKKFDAFVSDLEKRLSKFKGVKYRIIKTKEELQALGDKIAQLRDDKFADTVEAFVHGGTVYFYAPHLFKQGSDRTAQVIAHEIVGHIGMKRLLGDGWSDFAKRAWESMTPAERQERTRYHWNVNLTPKRRAEILKKIGSEEDPGTDWYDLSLMTKARILAAEDYSQKMIEGAVDEYLAKTAEKVASGRELDRNTRTVWQKIVDFIRHLFGSDKITERDIAETLIRSRENLTGDKVGTETAEKAVTSAEAKSESLGEQVKAAGEETDPNPTEGQKKAGNYRMGHVKIGPYDISIENRAGSVRSGTDANGKKWSTTMKNAYGYFKGTEGVDGDHIDVFLSNDIDNWDRKSVFVVDQYNPDGTFDEHKVMLGFNSKEEAMKAYLDNYEKGWENGRRLEITGTDMDSFHKWTESSHRKTKPFAEYGGVKSETKEETKSAGTKTEETKTAREETKRETGKKQDTSRKEVRHNEGHIDDYGEVLAGARKLLLGNIAEKMKNVDVKNLIALPLSKVFSRTDFFKQMQAGKISAEDALLLEAMQRAVYAEKKPSGQKRGTERRVQEWAERTYSVLDLFRQYCEAETDEQRRGIREKALSGKGVQTKDSYYLSILKLSDPEKYRVEKEKAASVSPIKAAMDILTGAGFPNRSIGAKVTVPTVERMEGYGKPFVVTLSANMHPAFATYEEARDFAVKVVKVQMGDTDVEYGAKDFRVVAGKTSFVPSGKYFVTVWKGARILSQTDFDSKEAAEAFIEERVSKGAKRESMNITERKAARVDKYILDVTDWTANAWIHLDDSPQFDSREEAQAWIADNIQELNERANTQMSEKYTKAAQSGPKIWDLLVSKGVGTDTWSVGYNPSGFLYVTVKDGFKSYHDAYQWAEANTVRVSEEINRTMAEVREMEKESHFNGERERRGTDWRKGKDVTAEQFGKKFGFRGVQFGNWTDQQDRQRALNEAYDAFMDLAELLHVSPEALSLAGELGIAFGARGSGWANAHYERGNVVINLTKTRGAGSLAHEWWHALDNYFARQGGVSLGMMTDESGGKAKVRDEVRTAYNDLVKAVEGSKYGKRSKARGAYWGSMKEETARLFAEWVNYRLGDQGKTNSFLADGYPQHMFDMWERFNLKKYKETSGDRDITLEEFRKKGDSLAGCPYPTREETDRLGKPIERLFDAIQERVEDGKTVLFSVRERNEATVANIRGQKEPGVTYETAGMDDLRFSVGKRRKEEMENRLKKTRPDIDETQRKALFDYLDTIGDTKIENAAFHWFVSGSVRLPEDMDKVRQAVKVAGMAKVDPASYRSPMELLNAHSDFKVRGDRIDPDTLDFLVNEKSYDDGVTVYDIDEPGRREYGAEDRLDEIRTRLREVINTHWGEDCNPWCLLQGDGEGNLTEDSEEYWNHYNKCPKRIAFKNGKLLAFCANDSRKPCWWDRNDEPHDGIPVTRKMEGDKLGRSAIYLLDTKTGKWSEPAMIYKGSRSNGTYEQWSKDGKTLLERSNWKRGKREGLYETWWNNGGAKERSVYRNDELVSEEWWNQSGVLSTRVVPTEDGGSILEEYESKGQITKRFQRDRNGRTKIADTWYENGQQKEHSIFRNDGWGVAESEEWYEDGSLKSSNDGTVHKEWYRNGAKKLYKDDVSRKEWYEDGTPKEEDTYRNGKQHGEHREWDRNGNLQLLVQYRDGMKDGVMKAWWNNGRPMELHTFKDGKEDGRYALYDTDDSLRVAGIYRNNRREGIWMDTDTRGDAKDYTEFHNGERNGLSVRTYLDGRIALSIEYAGERTVRTNVPLEEATQWLEKNGYEVERRQTDKGTDYYVKEKPEDGTLFSVSNQKEREEIIAKARENGTLGLAPNGKKSALYEKYGEQLWAAVRTTAFKDWFGDWEKSLRIEKLRNSASASITGNEIPEAADLKTYKDNAVAYGKTLQGFYRNDDTGRDIQLQRGRKNGGLKEVLQHDLGKVQIQSVAAIPQIIKNAIYITSEENNDTQKNPNVTRYHYYVCGLKIGGENYTVRMVEAEEANGSRYYDHKLTQIEKGELLDKLALLQKASPSELSSTSGPGAADQFRPADGGETQSAPVSGIKDKKLISILQGNSSKVVDENGEPLIVYHGSRTGGDFSVFNGETFFIDNKDVADMFRADASYRLMINGKPRLIGATDAQEIAEILSGGDYGPDEMTDWDDHDIDWYGLDEREKKRLYNVLYSNDIDIADVNSISLEATPDTFETFLNIRNPKIVDFGEKVWEVDNAPERSIVELKKQGYDGYIIRNIVEGGLAAELLNGEEVPPATDYIAFNPNQIKSATDNNGEYSADNPDIRFSNSANSTKKGLDDFYGNRKMTQEDRDAVKQKIGNKQHGFLYPFSVRAWLNMLSGIMPRAQFKLEYNITDDAIDLFSDSRLSIVSSRAYHHLYNKPQVVSRWEVEGDSDIYRNHKEAFDKIAERYKKAEKERGTMTATEWKRKTSEIIREAENIFNAERKRTTPTRDEVIDRLRAKEPIVLAANRLQRRHNSKDNMNSLRNYAKGFYGSHRIDGTELRMDVTFDGVKRAMWDNADDDTIQILASIPAIIRNCTYAFSLPYIYLNQSGIVRYNHYLCQVKMNGRDYVVRVVEAEHNDGKRVFADLRVTDQSLDEIVNGSYSVDEIDKKNGSRAVNLTSINQSRNVPGTSGQISYSKAQRVPSFRHKDKISVCYLQDSFGKSTSASSKLARSREESRLPSHALRQSMAQTARSMAEQLHLDNVEILTDTSSLPDEQMSRRGIYDPETGRITIVVPNHEDSEDVAKTVLHEAVAHYGLRQMFGEDFSKFLRNVFENAPLNVRQQIARATANNGWNIGEATEEYLATIAEDTDFRKEGRLWNRIKGFFREMLRKLGLTGKTITDNDLRYLLWKSYRNLKGRTGIVAQADDIAMQSSLKVGDYSDEVRFSARKGSFPEYEKTLARERYEQRVRTGRYQSVEAMQDSMLGLKEAMEAIVGKRKGKYIEDIEGFENPYLGENRLSSVNKAEADAFAHLVFKPMLDEVAKLARNEAEREDLTDYMMAKHGLERNAYMRRRAIQKEFDETTKDWPKVPAEYDGDPITQEWLDRRDNLQRDLEEKYAEYDYAGLTALTGKESASEAEAEARKMVKDYEGKHDTAPLWEKVNAVNKAVLSKQYECGMLSKETYEKIRDMYKWYIPLRGFDERTAEDSYAYLTHPDSAFNAPIRKAEGRRSKADDPFANMQAMAESAISQGNRNRLVKQKFLNFVMNHPSDLVSISDLWVRHDDTTDRWVPVFPDLRPEDDADTVAAKMKEFDGRMKKLKAEDPEHYKHGKDAAAVPYRIESKRDLKEHQVVVRRNGRDYILTINGNPRAAQALNGMTNPDNRGDRAWDHLIQVGESVNRWMSSVYTTRNPDFIVSNFLRDMMYANTIVWVKESPNYAVRFHLNVLKANPATMEALLIKHSRGTLNMDVPIERMFHEFIMNGGETGYTVLKDTDRRKSDIARELRKSKAISLEKALDMAGEELDRLNRAIELSGRFAAFMTSRDMGRSMDRAIWDAKEITVNFNKKGAGDRFMGANGQTFAGNTAAFTSGLGRSFYVFWNASVQGLTNLGRQFRRHPAKAIALAASLFAYGFIKAYMHAAGSGSGDDDRNSYFNLPEWTRRSNILIDAGDNKWVALPLSVEYRSLYGMGELLGSLASGKERMSAMEITEAVAEQLSQALPVDFLEGGANNKWANLLPSSIKPAVEAYVMNRSWTGMPIYNGSKFIENRPEWTKAYSSANRQIVGLCAALNEATGGDRYTRGAVNLNPAKIEYMLNASLGGYFSMADKMVKMTEMAVGKRDFDPQGVMLLNRVLKSGDERTEYRALNNAYYKISEKYDELYDRMNHYRADMSRGIADYADKIHRINSSPDYGRMQIYRKYKSAVEKNRRAMKSYSEAGDDERYEACRRRDFDLKRRMFDEIGRYDSRYEEYRGRSAR